MIGRAWRWFFYRHDQSWQSLAWFYSVVAFLIFVFFLWLNHPAKAHDHWINQNKLVDPVTGAWCCDERDCEMIPAGGVTPVEGGYKIEDTGEVIELKRVIWKSMDGRWWRCRFSESHPTRCLIGPPPGS